MLTYITIRHRAVTVLRGYENAWKRPSQVRRLGDGTTRQSGRIRNRCIRLLSRPPCWPHFLPWLMLNRDGPSILLYRGTGDAYADHIDHAVWLGSVLPLRMNVLRESRKTPSHC